MSDRTEVFRPAPMPLKPGLYRLDDPDIVPKMQLYVTNDRPPVLLNDAAGRVHWKNHQNQVADFLEHLGDSPPGSKIARFIDFPPKSDGLRMKMKDFPEDLPTGGHVHGTGRDGNPIDLAFVVETLIIEHPGETIPSPNEAKDRSIRRYYYIGIDRVGQPGQRFRAYGGPGGPEVDVDYGPIEWVDAEPIAAEPVAAS